MNLQHSCGEYGILHELMTPSKKLQLRTRDLACWSIILFLLVNLRIHRVFFGIFNFEF